MHIRFAEVVGLPREKKGFNIHVNVQFLLQIFFLLHMQLTMHIGTLLLLFLLCCVRRVLTGVRKFEEQAKATDADVDICDNQDA